MERGNSSAVNGWIDVRWQNHQRTEDKARPAMVDFDVLDCPVCMDPLTSPVVQCENGHLACSFCSPKLNNQCPTCASPIGHIRCRAMEAVLESVFVPCKNASFGCTENISYCKLSNHEMKCTKSEILPQTTTVNDPMAASGSASQPMKRCRRFPPIPRPREAPLQQTIALLIKSAMASSQKLNELSPILISWRICVFILSVFKKNLGPLNRFELGLILVDETGQRIEATIDPLNSVMYLDRIRENEWKHITVFRVLSQSGSVRATSHLYQIRFLQTTVVTDAVARKAEVFTNFIPIDFIIDRTFDTRELVDVLGALGEVGELTNSSPTGTDIDGYNVTFTIKDKGKRVINCEAFGSNASNLYKIYQTEGHIVIALVMWKVERDSDDPDNIKVVSYGEVSKLYANPDIPAADEVKMALA